MPRELTPPPRTFEEFPVSSTCPVCGTNNNGLTVLVPIDDTEEGNLVQCVPVHLACAVAQGYSLRAGLLYTRAPFSMKSGPSSL